MPTKPKPKSTEKPRGRRSTLPLSRPATVQDIVDLAQQYGPACINTLVDVANNGSDTARVSAANSILDRGYGKAKQGVELSGEINATIKLPDDLVSDVRSLLASWKPQGKR